MKDDIGPVSESYAKLESDYRRTGLQKLHTVSKEEHEKFG